MCFSVWFYCKVMNILTSFLCFTRVQNMENYFRVVFYINMVSFRRQFPFTFLGKSRERKRKTDLPTIMLYPWFILSSTLALEQWLWWNRSVIVKKGVNSMEKIEQNEIIQFQAHQRDFNLWKKGKGHYLQVVSQIQSTQDFQEIKV